jgi:hypothetical protein
MARSVALLATLLLGCAGASETARVGAADAAPRARYEATWTGTGDLEVVVRATGGFDEVALEPGAEAYVSDLRVADAEGRPAAYALGGSVYRVPACAGPCTIRYRLALGSVAEWFDDPELAAVVGGAVFSPPTTWLLHPEGRPEGRFELDVKLPPDVAHVSGLHEPSRHHFEAELADLPQAPYAAFGDLRRRTIELRSGKIDLAIAGETPAVGDEALEGWVRAAASNVEGYLGRFPMDRAAIFVIVGAGGAIGHATALGNGGASILARVGADTPARALDDDWIMTHEIVHLAMPGLHARHNWMEEGLATYLEPLARARRGVISAEDVWSEWYFDMRQGLPASTDGGLDGTESWGRTYWGGAVFWLLAELEIRKAAGPHRSLRDCLRSVIDAGGNISVRWSAKRFVDSCDAALPAPILGPLYERHAREAVPVDLDALFAELGVRRSQVGVELDDSAPGARIRRAITGVERQVASSTERATSDR